MRWQSWIGKPTANTCISESASLAVTAPSVCVSSQERGGAAVGQSHRGVQECFAVRVVLKETRGVVDGRGAVGI